MAAIMAATMERKKAKTREEKEQGKYFTKTE
jgi:hypothetical protein